MFRGTQYALRQQKRKERNRVSENKKMYASSTKLIMRSIDAQEEQHF